MASRPARHCPAAAPSSPYRISGQPQRESVQSQHDHQSEVQPLDPNSASNPIGRYGSSISPDSLNNPVGAGNPLRSDSPRNPYGSGWRIERNQ